MDIMNLCEKPCSSSVPRLDTAAALLDVDDANENVLRQKVWNNFSSEQVRTT